MKLILKKIIILSVLLVSVGIVFAQTASEAQVEENTDIDDWEYIEDLAAEGGIGELSDSYKQEALSERDFDKSEWEALVKDISFKEEKEKKKEYKPKESNAPMFNGISKTAKAILFGIAILALVFIIIKIFVGNVTLTNKKVSATRPIILEEVEENLHESDLDRYLREALTNKNYKVAIRLYYLMIIKELSSRNLIRWKLDKTNRDYLSEMSNHNTFTDFRNITRTFDKVWYGEFAVEQEHFSEIGPLFEQYINKIKS